MADINLLGKIDASRASDTQKITSEDDRAKFEQLLKDQLLAEAEDDLPRINLNFRDKEKEDLDNLMNDRIRSEAVVSAIGAPNTSQVSTNIETQSGKNTANIYSIEKIDNSKIIDVRKTASDKEKNQVDQLLNNQLLAEAVTSAKSIQTPGATSTGTTQVTGTTGIPTPAGTTNQAATNLAQRGAGAPIPTTGQNQPNQPKRTDGFDPRVNPTTNDMI